MEKFRYNVCVKNYEFKSYIIYNIVQQKTTIRIVNHNQSIQRTKTFIIDMINVKMKELNIYLLSIIYLLFIYYLFISICLLFILYLYICNLK